MGVVSGIKAALGGVKKAANGVKNGIKNAGKALEAADVFKEFLKKKIKIYLIIGLLVLVVVAALVQLLRDLFGQSDNAVRIKIDSSNYTAPLSQQAKDIYNKYGSCLAFTLDQIDESVKEAYKAFEKNEIVSKVYKSNFGTITDSKKEKIKELYQKIENENPDFENLNSGDSDIVKYYNSLKANKTNSISEFDNVSIYTHVLRTEKYNFNNIKWRAIRHNQDTKDIDKTKFNYDDSLGLYYPSEGNVQLSDLIDLLSPYLLTSKIPAAYLAASNYVANESTSIGRGQYDAYLEKSLGTSSKVGTFAYLTTKFAQSNITMSQYNLDTRTVQTKWQEYDAYTTNVTFNVRKEPIYDDDGNFTGDYRYSYVENSYSNGQDNQTRPVANEQNVDSRMDNGQINVMKEEQVSDNITTDIQYKLESAQAVDVNIVNGYDYRIYSDDDVKNRVNPNGGEGVVSVTNRKEVAPNQTNYISEGDLKSRGMQQYVDGKTEDDGVVKISGGDGDEDTKIFRVTLGNYVYRDVDETIYQRTWCDTLQPDPELDRKILLGISDIMSFNMNEDKDSEKTTYNFNEFREDNESIAYFQTQLVDNEETAINSIDIMDSNKKIYNKYIASASANAKFSGYGRKSYVIIQGNNSVEDAFNELINNDVNNGTLPFVYGASWGFDVGADPAPAFFTGNWSTTFNLLKDYLHSWQSEPRTTSDNENYIIYKDSEENLMIGWGIKVSDYEDVILASGVEEIKEGAQVPVEIIDKIEDDEINDRIDTVKSITNGLDLKEYQIHALVARIYESPLYLFLGSSPNMTFNTAYDNYWNQENDDEYEAKHEANDTTVEYTHSLYTNFMSGPNEDQDQNLKRKFESQFKLFKIGYYDTTDKWYTAMSGENPEGVDVYNSDNTVNEEQVKVLQEAIEQRLNLVSANKDFSGRRVAVTNSDKARVIGKFYGSTGGIFSEKYLEIYQCTWWANCRASEYLYLKDPEKWPNGYPTARGNGGDYYDNNKWFNTGYEPKPHSIGCYKNGSYGHVFYVEAVDYKNNCYYISHAGGGESWYGIQRVTIGQSPWGSSVQMQPFIYLDEPLS